MDFFGRIVAQRQGHVTALRPALAPHFAPRSLPLGDADAAAWPGEVQAEVGAPGFPASRGATTSQPGAAARPAGTGVEAAAARGPGLSSPQGAAASLPVPAATSQPGSLPPRRLGAWPPGSVDRPAAQVPVLAEVGRAGPAAADLSAAAPRVRAASGGSAWPAQVPARAAPTGLPLAPARAAMLAAPSAPARADAAPVVHVHIDRIDVRAPAAAPAPAAPHAARPAPARSLGDYLRQGGRR